MLPRQDKTKVAKADGETSAGRALREIDESYGQVPKGIPQRHCPTLLALLRPLLRPALKLSGRGRGMADFGWRCEAQGDAVLAHCLGLIASGWCADYTCPLVQKLCDYFGDITGSAQVVNLTAMAFNSSYTRQQSIRLLNLLGKIPHGTEDYKRLWGAVLECLEGVFNDNFGRYLKGTQKAELKSAKGTQTCPHINILRMLVMDDLRYFAQHNPALLSMAQRRLVAANPGPPRPKDSAPVNPMRTELVRSSAADLTIDDFSHPYPEPPRADADGARHPDHTRISQSIEKVVLWTVHEQHMYHLVDPVAMLAALPVRP